MLASGTAPPIGVNESCEAITAPVDVLGTASDNNLRFYNLEVASFGSTQFREIARGTDLTERAVYQIVRELEEHHFIQKRRVGRRNIYTVNEAALFSFPVYQDLNIAQMITALRRILEERRVTA